MGQFKALSQKNWILWKRNLCGNICQIVIPIIFVLFLTAIRGLIEIDKYQQQAFLGNATYEKDLYGTAAAATADGSSLFLKSCGINEVVALAPSGDPLVTALQAELINAGYTGIELFASQAAIYQRVRSINYGVTLDRLCFGITVVDSTAGSSYKYKLHFNQSNNPTRTDAPPTSLQLLLDQALNLDYYSKSIVSGILGTTTLINNQILQTQTATTNVFKNKIAPIYQQAYQKDSIYSEARANIGILFLLPLLIIYLRQTSVMLSQKEKKIRQTMSIMGMNLPTYYFTWFLRYLITCLIVHIICSLIVTSTLPYVPFIIPFIVFVLFDMLLIVQSFFIQTFFTRAKLGVVIALLFFLLQYILSFLVSNSDNPTQSVNTTISIIPHVAFILAFQTMFYAESVKNDLTFTSNLNKYTISTAIVSFLLNILFWLFLTWYLEQVFPNQFGSKKHPLFCCVKEDKKTSNYSLDNQDLSDSQLSPSKNGKKPDIQEVEPKYKLQEKEKKIIQIKNLRKQFNNGQTVAVHDLSVKMYNDNIFVLLGHNGAGKTTTISMLTGMLSPSNGTIQVLGESQISKIRQMIGVCPQHDTLYDELTVQEHLQLIGTFKNLEGTDLDQQVNKLIADVNLAQKRQQYSKNLSGGQKRRLSVAMAFSGRSKVIILDEPTSGMDTSARRYIWQLLKGYKTDRIILLTTHFMDEADYLGDRIGIMAGGRLICCGSGYYLKNKFGVGYNITFVKKNSQTSSDRIINVVKKHIPQATLLSNVSSQMTMQLPMDKVKHFPNLFNQIDSNKNQLSISTYGISITTLQEVFLKVGQETQNLQDIRNATLKNISQNQPNNHLKKYPKVDINSLAKDIKDQASHERGTTQTRMLTEEKIDRIEEGCVRFGLHFWATILKRLRVIKRDYKSFILQLLLPMFIIILALLLMTVSFIVDLPERELTLNTYKQEASPLLYPIGSANTTLLNNLETQANDLYGSQLTISKDTSSTTAADFDFNYLFPRKKTENFLMGGIFFDGSRSLGSNTLYQYTTITNTKIPTSYFYLQTLAAETYINQISPGNVSITMVKSPFPRTFDQLQINNTISGFFGALIFSIALGFKFASIIAFIVKERQDKSKHQQIVSGMNIFSYWFGNYLYDFVLYLILAIFSVIMCIALDAEAFIGDAFGVTCVAFLLYGLAYIPLTYICSYLFKDYGNAQAAYYFFTFVVGGLLSIIILILRFLQGQANTVGRVLAWIFRIFPCYCFGEILINLGSINLLGIVQLDIGEQYSPWALQISLAPIIYLIVEIFLFTILVFVLENALNNENFMRFWSSENKIEQTQDIEDSDVLLEKQKALKADPNQYEILTKNLRKVYMLDSAKKYKVAVDNLSVAIEKGQVFGLLGINGAGKTTTFKMLAGQITSTSGDSFFNGMKISQNLSKVRQNLGYCPQFDALIENLTVREQLQLFYDMKSLPGQYKDQLVTQKIKQMDLQKYQDKLSGTLSGGNKRKLSVAMAMIGNPNIVFLDEPSTGMDPKARRFMWKIISKIASQKKQSTIILTTHSMQQAQALSTRLGIMVNGNFKCIGTPQHIKSKYGQGYEVQIKIVPCRKDEMNTFIEKNKLQSKESITEEELIGFLNYVKAPSQIRNEISATGSGNYLYNQLISTQKIDVFQLVQFILLYEKIKDIKKFMDNKFGGCEVIESFQTFIRLKTKANLSVGKMFQILENDKEKVQIESYSIKQATVEQIFNRFAQDGQLSEML